MNDKDLKIFIDSALNYFKETTQKEAVAGIPYVKGKDPVVLDFTGIIGISGKQKGCIYLTAPEKMLRDLGDIILGVANHEHQDLKDLIGEIANTIAGNVRNVYGSSFLISVPAVVLGIPTDIIFPEEIPTFIVPFKWQEYRTYLAVGLE
jgi:chemotaxis protein CheX